MDAVHTPAVTLSWKNIRVRVKQDHREGSLGAAGRSWRSWMPTLPSSPGFGAGEPLLGWRAARQKLLIDGVSGAVDGGSFLAVVGASGTGKTTLLAAITKRLRGRAVSGDVLLNGRAASAKLLARVCGFVPQKDLATVTLTTTEHLNFMAVMRLDARVSASARARRIRVLLADLGLTACAHTRLAHLSGGERRRVALAVQLMVSPLVLALDEPCSGLDAEGSRVVLEALRREAGRGRAVLCTVHQAAPDLLRLFSHILVLSAGRVVFQGPLDDAQPFLAEVGARGQAGWTASTPLDAMLQQLCDPAAHLDTARVCTAFANSGHAQILEEYPVSEEVLARDVIRAPDIKHVSWFTEVSWLVWREVVDARRQNSRVFAQLALFLVTAAIMSLAFMDVRLTSLAGVQSVRGLLYLIVSEVVFTHSYAVFHTFPAELPIYLRESDLYSSSAYYVGKVLATVPRSAIEPLLFVGVIQSQVDLTAGGGVVTFVGVLGILFLTALTASAYGCMLSAQFESPEMVLAVTQPVDFICVLSAGIFNTIRSLPFYIKWTRFVSVFFYCHEMLSIVYWQNVVHIDCPVSSPDLPCLKDGGAVLEDIGFDTANLGRDLLGLGALCLGLHVVGFLGVVRRSRQQSAF
ncbi:LOW QUALITY PROTEIN: protein scarlet-like [Thrips palmi]|uniref:LOW QUALITY PROTEIN: protein scarlet-like n=1 Tax=Thrips palmi TaxID=161013 RepID=A0A6P9A545_THRPL|nr:LOW QUALITY PROTEIN: protein scarlet-like [Thrips palmi]